jgi:hypothetical protein
MKNITYLQNQNFWCIQEINLVLKILFIFLFAAEDDENFLKSCDFLDLNRETFIRLVTIFRLCIPPKDLAKPHFNTNLIFTSQNFNVLSGNMTFWREVQYQMKPFICHISEQHISKCNYEILVVQENHISRLELKRCFL